MWVRQKQVWQEREVNVTVGLRACVMPGVCVCCVHVSWHDCQPSTSTPAHTRTHTTHTTHVSSLGRRSRMRTAMVGALPATALYHYNVCMLCWRTTHSGREHQTRQVRGRSDSSSYYC